MNPFKKVVAALRTLLLAILINVALASLVVIVPVLMLVTVGISCQSRGQ